MSTRREFGVWAGAVLAALLLSVQESVAADVPLVQRPWFEARTTFFHTYSCGPTQEVARLAARLEQFRVAYSLLAGTQAVASPPIIVLAFPDRPSLEQFLPLYNDKPANLASFFSRGSDENLIALSLSDTGNRALEAVFHEYAHLLLRHNEPFWPMWLHEGMADIYATFEVTGSHSARIGKPMADYLYLLTHKPLLPLQQLFAVGHDSPEYNERDRQGTFYAESWLLTHYLMLGNPARAARFGNLTTLLRLGQAPEEAFTNNFRITLPAMEKELRAYLERQRFDPLPLSVQANLMAPQPLATRPLTPVEIRYRLGDELLRIGRLDTAETYFKDALATAPGSPLPYEGLGLLAAEQGRHTEALSYLQDALNRGSASFLAHYAYAREKFRLAASAPDSYTRLPEPVAAEIEAQLGKALAIMPDFGPAHHLLGFLQVLQDANLKQAEQHLIRAVQLEPENQAYLLTLAQAQIAARNIQAARQTLEPLRRPNVSARLRTQAERIVKQLSAEEQGSANEK